MTGRSSKVGSPPDGEAWIWHSLIFRLSMAWRGRSWQLARLLEHLEVEYLRHKGLTNGSLLAPYDQIENLGIWRRQIAEVIAEGERRGLIRVSRGAYDVITGKRQSSAFRLTYLRYTDEQGELQPPTDEWRRFSEPQRPPKRSNFKNRKPGGETATGAVEKPPLGQSEESSDRAKNQVEKPPPVTSGDLSTAIYISRGSPDIEEPIERAAAPPIGNG